MMGHPIVRLVGRVLLASLMSRLFLCLRQLLHHGRLARSSMTAGRLCRSVFLLGRIGRETVCIALARYRWGIPSRQSCPNFPATLIRIWRMNFVGSSLCRRQYSLCNNHFCGSDGVAVALSGAGGAASMDSLLAYDITLLDRDQDLLLLPVPLPPLPDDVRLLPDIALGQRPVSADGWPVATGTVFPCCFSSKRLVPGQAFRCIWCSV